MDKFIIEKTLNSPKILSFDRLILNGLVDNSNNNGGQFPAWYSN